MKNAELYTLTGETGLVPGETLEAIIHILDEVYPAIRAEYGRAEAEARVELRFDPEYEKEEGIAYCTGKLVVVNPHYLVRRPADADCVTHELIHVAQDYGDFEVDWWVTEGIADYGRNKFGVNNAACGWSLPDRPREGWSYDSGYTVTAAFFAWLEKSFPDFTVKELNRRIQSRDFTLDYFRELTGSDVGELWARYSA